MHVYDILQKPVITEKTAILGENGKYTFKIRKDANKRHVKEAVEKAFKVTVLAVNIINVPGKRRRVGRQRVLTQSWKKAVVTLKAGQKIELYEGV